MKMLTANKHRYIMFSNITVFTLMQKVGDRAKIQGSNGGGSKSVKASAVIRLVIQLSNTQAMEAQCRNKSLVDRKKALDMEKERARKIANMPSPQSYDIVMVCMNERISILFYL